MTEVLSYRLNKSFYLQFISCTPLNRSLIWSLYSRKLLNVFTWSFHTDDSWHRTLLTYCHHAARRLYFYEQLWMNLCWVPITVCKQMKRAVSCYSLTAELSQRKPKTDSRKPLHSWSYSSIFRFHSDFYMKKAKTSVSSDTLWLPRLHHSAPSPLAPTEAWKH